MKILTILAVVLLFSSTVTAQPAHTCGVISNLSVMYDRVDAGGYAPSMKTGDQNQFNCIANRDPYFHSQRFPTSVLAANYWLGLLGQEFGASIGLLPAN